MSPLRNLYAHVRRRLSYTVIFRVNYENTCFMRRRYERDFRAIVAAYNDLRGNQSCSTVAACKSFT